MISQNLNFNKAIDHPISVFLFFQFQHSICGSSLTVFHDVGCECAWMWGAGDEDVLLFYVLDLTVGWGGSSWVNHGKKNGTDSLRWHRIQQRGTSILSEKIQVGEIWWDYKPPRSMDKVLRVFRGVCFLWINTHPGCFRCFEVKELRLMAASQHRLQLVVDFDHFPRFDLERWNCKSKKQLLPRAASCKSGCSISFLRDLATNRSTFVNALHLSWFSLLLVMGTIPNAWCSGHCIARSIFSLANV